MEQVPGSSNINPASTLVPALTTGVSSGIGSAGVIPCSSGIVHSVHEETSSSTAGILGTSSFTETSRCISGILSSTSSPVLSPPGKIFGRNANGTMVATSIPRNEAELQLYRVLQRASLLAYYDTLLEMGGDDVQQLYDAGEEEFLEIMALVGMASKPLHVRRLQKALHEWAQNPSAFQTPLPSTSTDPTQFAFSPEPTMPRVKTTTSPSFHPTPLTATVPASVSLSVPALTPQTPNPTVSSHVTSSSLQLTPTLTEAQISRLATAAEKMARELPQCQPRTQTSRKRATRELEQVMAMSENDPRRMEEIRKYAAIYGRFDCKRRPEKPLTLHEVCVNEAAAQLCKYVPALLTRRDELFPLARQLVKDVGFGHSSNIARLTFMTSGQKPDDGQIGSGSGTSKRTKVESDPNSGEFSKDIIEESRHLFAMYHKLGRPFDFSEAAKFSFSQSDNDEDNDSRFSFSTSSSPNLQHLNGSEADGRDPSSSQDVLEEKGDKSPVRSVPTSPLGVQIISSSGGHIIAVANPALAMSPALSETPYIKRETMSPDL